MKKTLIAMGVLGAFSSLAFAASNVTLYGIIEEGVIVQKAKHGDNKVELNSGFGQGSRWGIKGVEDLGNGYSAGFVLEQGFNADNGNEATSGKAFSRESFLYVKGGFGSFGFGRTGALSFAQTQAILTGWAFGTSYGASSWQSAIANNFSRMDNVLSYATPVFDGFSGHVMYSNGLTSDSEKWSDNNHYYGIGVKYQANAIRSSLIFEAADNKGSATDAQLVSDVYTETQWKALGNTNWAAVKDNVFKAATAKKKAIYVINYGFEYNLGSWTPMFAYQFAHQDNGRRTHMFGLSATPSLVAVTYSVRTMLRRLVPTRLRLTATFVHGRLVRPTNTHSPREQLLRLMPATLTPVKNGRKSKTLLTTATRFTFAFATLSNLT